jgi:ketosteroid isomerase-like protein
MPRNKIEVLRRALDAFARGDSSALTELATDDVEWGTTGGFAGIRPLYRGAAALDEWVRDIREAWAAFDVSVDEVLFETDEVAVVVERLTASGRGSGAPVDMRVFSAFWFRNGRICKRIARLERSEALEAVGLSA